MPIEVEPVTPPGAEGEITNQSLMEAMIARENYNTLADMVGNNEPADIAAGAQWAINAAESFNGWLARQAGHTTVPLPSSSADYPYLETLVTKLAVGELNVKRGQREESTGPAGHYSKIKEEAEAKLREFYAGTVDGSGIEDAEYEEPVAITRRLNDNIINERTLKGDSPACGIYP